MIINPADSFSPGELNRLDQFLAKGKNLLIATDPIKAKVRKQRLLKEQKRLINWLRQKGIAIQNKVVLDAQCGMVPVGRQRIKFPYFPIIGNFEDHPVTKGVARVFLPYSSPVKARSGKKLNFSVLARTSRKTGKQPLPSIVKVNKQWKEKDFPQAKLPVAIAAEGKWNGSKSLSRLVVVGSGNLIPSQKSNTQRSSREPQVRKGNADFLVNAVDWVSDQMGLMALRTQGMNARPLDDLSDRHKSILKYGNAFAPIALMLLIGLVRYQQQLIKRKRWMLQAQA